MGVVRPGQGGARCRRLQQYLAPYVLGRLDDGERRPVDAHVPGCPRCSAIVAELRLPSRALALADPDAVVRTMPPARRELVLERILAVIEALPAEPAESVPTAAGDPGPPGGSPNGIGPEPAGPGRLPGHGGRGGRGAGTPWAGGRAAASGRRVRSRARTAVAAGLAAAFIAVAVLVTARSSSTPDTETVRLSADPGVSATVLLHREDGWTSVRLAARGLPAGKPYRAWLARCDGGRVVAGDVFTAPADGRVDLTLAAQLDRSRATAVGFTGADLHDVAASPLGGADDC